MDSQTKPRDASPQGRVTRNATRLQKRQLEDPGDISISRAQPKKKNKPKKKDVVAANVPTAPSLNTTPRTTVSSPAPAQVVSSVPSPTAPPTLGPDAPSPAVPAASQTQGKKKKKKAPTNQPSNASAPPATEPPNTPEQGTEKVAKRVKNPSPIAREVIQQETLAQQQRETKAKKKAKKAESVVINESPEETRAFLERIKANKSTVAIPDAPAHSQQTVAANKQKAMSQMIQHQKIHIATAAACTPTPSVVSVPSTIVSSSFSSLAPSESISQASHPSSKSHGRTVKKSNKPASTQSFLDAPLSQASSRDVSPIPDSLADGELVDIGTDIDIDPVALLDDIPPPLAPALKLPAPLPEPLHVIQRLVPLEPIDFSKLTASERAKQKRKHRLQVKHLHPGDQTIVSAAINRMESLLVMCCGFPNEETCWILANMANVWACKKFGQNLALTRDSEYKVLLYNRISSMRSGLVSLDNSKEIHSVYGLRSKTDPDSVPYNRQLVAKLLQDGDFTCPSFDDLDALYEHPVFETILKSGYFQSATSDGPTHRDLWKCITIPCLALVATAVEKLLMDYKSGVYVRVAFTAKEFAPRYVSHVASLVEMYKTNVDRLQEHCSKLAAHLHKPYGTGASLGAHIRPRVPASLIASRYASKSTKALAEANPSIDITQSAPKQVDIPHIVDQLTAKLASYAQEYHKSTDAEIAEAIYASHHNDSSSNLKVYDGLLSQVTGGSSDSEVQARRAGAIPEDPQELVQGILGLQEEDDDDDENEEEGKCQRKTEEEEDDDDDDDENEGAGAGTGGGGDDDDEDDDDDDGHRNTNDANAFAPPTSGIEINISDSDDSESESDGEGTSGARLLVVPHLDGDMSMRTAVLDSDESDSNSE